MRVSYILCFLFVFLASCEQKKIKAIIRVDHSDVKNMMPKDFRVAEKFKTIVVNDSAKLGYSINVMTDVEPAFSENVIKSDTLNDRILRVLTSNEVSKDRFEVNYKMVDLKSEEIPTIFGNPKNGNITYEIVNLYTLAGKTLSGAQLDSMKVSLFKHP